MNMKLSIVQGDDMLDNKTKCLLIQKNLCNQLVTVTISVLGCDYY